MLESGIASITDNWPISDDSDNEEAGRGEASLLSQNAHLPRTSTRETVMNQPRFEIVQQDMGGWVRVYLGRGEPTGEVAPYLSHSLTEWLRKNPQIKVRIIVPISRDGDTAELHVWYD